MSVVVFVEIKNKVSKAALEAVSYGSKLGKVNVVTYGDASEEVLSEMSNYGAENIFVCRSLSENNDQKITNLIAAAVEKSDADL
jgi:electron transfer flavoprotein alpha/beta subunit